jgi:hypothetical protein
VRRLFLAAALLSGCGFRGLRPGATEDGLAISVAGSDPVYARRAALESVLGFYLSPQRRAASKDALDELLARPARFTGKEKLSGGSGLVEVKLGALGAALDEAGLVRPPGFPKGPGRVLIVLSEPAGSLGAGYAADALRRALAARGISAADAGDRLVQNPSLRAPASPEELARRAFSSGVDYVLIGTAVAEAAPDAASGVFRAQALLDARLKASFEDAGSPVDGSSEGVDVSSAAALSKALEQAGDSAAGPASSAIAAARQGRSEVTVEARGNGGAGRMAGLITTLRGLSGVKGAALAAHRTEDGGALIKVFCEGIKADELAARLLRGDSTLAVIGIEPENGRVIVELSAAEGL